MEVKTGALMEKHSHRVLRLELIVADGIVGATDELLVVVREVHRFGGVENVRRFPGRICLPLRERAPQLQLTCVGSPPTGDGESDLVGAVELEPELEDPPREILVNLPPVREACNILR